MENMISVSGIYENGKIKLDKHIKSRKKSRVIVTFLDEMVENDEKTLTKEDFSFKSSRAKTKRYKGSVSDSIVEERRAER